MAFSGSWAQLCRQYSILHGHRPTEPCEFTSFCFPFLFSSYWFLIFLHATCVFKPKWLEVFPSTSVVWVLLHTHNTEQPVKCSPISIKVASVMLCILYLLSSSSSWEEGSQWLCQYDVQVTLSYIPGCSRGIATRCWVQVETSKDFYEHWLFGLVCGLTLMSKKCEFQLKLFFCGCRFVFCVVPPMPNRTCVPVQPFVGEDVDNTRTLCLQCLFSQNLQEFNFFLDLCPSVKLNWTRPTGSKVIRGRQNKHSMSALTLFSQELGWKSSLPAQSQRSGRNVTLTLE